MGHATYTRRRSTKRRQPHRSPQNPPGHTYPIRSANPTAAMAPPSPRIFWLDIVSKIVGLTIFLATILLMVLGLAGALLALILVLDNLFLH